MKKAIFLSVLALLCAWTAAAQDRIVRTDDTSVEARVTEITPQEIRYKRFSNPDGPTYILPIEQVRYIVYPNGERDVFNDPRDVASAAEVPAAPLAASPVPLRAYAVGDYYEQGAVRGVVCSVTDEGMHGLVLSLDEAMLPWTGVPKSRLAPMGCTSNGDGEANMHALAQYIEEHGLSWADFPAFEWSRNQGEGWYLPSIDELLLICANYNGGTRLGFS